jgi:hypothetical protein
VGTRLGGVEEVAREQKFEPAAERMPVRGADHRHGAIEQRPVLSFENLVLRLPFLPGHAVALLEIAAGAKNALAGAGQNDGAQIAGRRD